MKLTRRAVLLSLPVVTIARDVLAQAGRPRLYAQGLSQITLAVSDVKRSLDFYQRLFGMPIQARQGPTLILRIGTGPQHLALTPATGTPTISRLGIAVKDFTVDPMLNVLAEHGITRADDAAGGLSGGPMKVRVRMRGPDLGGAREGTPEIFFGDPDGIVVQLQDVKFAGGAGTLGDVVKVEPTPVQGLLELKDVNHFTISATDAARSNQFYRELFGFGIRAYQGPTAPALAVGSTVQFIMFTGPGPARGGGSGTPAPLPPRAANINHACMNMENFNVEKVQKALESVGIRPRSGNGPAGPMQHYVSLRMESRGGAKEGTPELYFTDPDGLVLQLQDARYCGGSGYLGDVCPPV